MVYYVTNQLQHGYDVHTIDECLEYFRDIQEIQIDTETTGHFNHEHRVLLLQLGAEDQWVIDFQSLDTKDRLKLNSILVSDKIKLLHNAKFDIKFIWRHGLDINNVYDTMLAERLLNAGKERPKGFYSLYSLGKRYCNVELDKSVRGEIKTYGITERVIEYAAADVRYLSQIKAQQMIELKRLGLANDDCQDIYTVLGLENNAVLAFASIEYTGLKLDVDKWRVIEEELGSKVNDLKEDLNRMVCEHPKLGKYCYTYVDLFTPAHDTTRINWSSPAQKLEILKALDSSIEDTSERTLQKLKSKHPIVSKMLEYSKTNKLYTAFAKKMYDHVNPVTGRVHTEFWQILDTGRVSSSEPNLQQIPSRSDVGKKMRECFVAAKGNKIVGGDYSGCELRIIAEFSEDPVWIDAFLNGKDLHSELCAMTFDIDISKVKDKTPFKPDISYRDVQKTLNFGLAYGMSEHKLADTIDISVKEAKAIIIKFFNAVPKVQAFLNMIGYIGKTYGRIKSPKPYQRIRFFEDYQTEDFARLGEIERQSKNHPIQSGNADMTKLALILIYRYIKEHNYPANIIHQVHDEIQTEVAEDKAQEWKQIMNDLMNQAASVILKKVPMITDCKISDMWSK